MYLFNRYFLKYKQEPQAEANAQSVLSEPPEKLAQYSIATKLVAFIIFTVGFLAIGFSRFILGVHSANQILYGFLLGLWTILMCVVLVDPLIEEQLAGLKSKSVPMEQVQKQIMWYGGLSLFALGSQIAVYWYVDSKNAFDLDPAYKALISKCSGKAVTTRAVQDENIGSAGAVMLAFGAFLGVVLKYTKLTPPERKSLAPTGPSKFVG